MLAFEVVKLHDFWHFLILNSENFSPSWPRGAMNHVLVYILFVSFLENLDIDEFSKMLRHCTFENDECFLLLIA
jgi:hypothetical protein